MLIFLLKIPNHFTPDNSEEKLHVLRYLEKSFLVKNVNLRVDRFHKKAIVDKNVDEAWAFTLKYLLAS
jgi:peroxiredoxin